MVAFKSPSRGRQPTLMPATFRDGNSRPRVLIAPLRARLGICIARVGVGMAKRIEQGNLEVERQRATQPASSAEQFLRRHRTPAGPDRFVTVAARNLHSANLDGASLHRHGAT